MNFDRKSAILMTVLAALFWSSGGVFIKVLKLNPFTILCYRSFFAALIFLVIYRQKLLFVNKITWISCLFYVPLLILFVVSTKLTTAANAIFLQYTAPAFVLVFEPFFTKEKLSKINVLTVCACFIGMSLFVVGEFSSPKNWLGIFLALASGIMLAGLLISQRLNRAEYQPPAIFYGNIIVYIATYPLIAQESIPVVDELLILMVLGFGQLGLGYCLFLYGQRHLPAIESALIAMLEPILNPVWVFIGTGEKPGIWAFIGGAVIIIALSFRLFWIEVQTKARYPT